MFIIYGNLKWYSSNGFIWPSVGVSMGGFSTPFYLFGDTPDMIVIVTDRLSNLFCELSL